MGSALDGPASGDEFWRSCVSPQWRVGSYLLPYRGYSKLRTHTALGSYGREHRTTLGAVRVLNFE